MKLASSIRSALRIGPVQGAGLAFRKLVKRWRYSRMMRTPNAPGRAEWKGTLPSPSGWPQAARELILAQADAMLRDENRFFSFPYRLREIERVWEFDPTEQKYWPRRHYTEQHLHASDTPRDAKIVWEINRFKDLPVLGQAYALTGDARYAEEALRRMHSWIEGNPFASTINWASALEISIRLISWTTTMMLLGNIGDANISRSICKQARYLAADLSTDKLVPSNHLIGEAAGLFVISTLWKFPHAKKYARRAKQILSREILRQTFDDGVTREASSWYHQFVTDLFDLADRVGAAAAAPLSAEFRKRLATMKAFHAEMRVNNAVVRYGDADDGWALCLAGNGEAWKEALFGEAPTLASDPPIHYYKNTHVIAIQSSQAFLFLRAGAFGMGGAGSASHAHDDFLSPIIRLAGEPVLSDPGTYVYNGNPEARNRFRVAKAHNGIVIGPGTGAEPKLNFGWRSVRPDAKILEASFTDRESIVTAQYGEWLQHRRLIKIKRSVALVVDRFDPQLSENCAWQFHLDPQWTLRKQQADFYVFQNSGGKNLSIKFRGKFESIRILPYDFSPSYGVVVPATMLYCTASKPTGMYAVLFTIESAL